MANAFGQAIGAAAQLAMQSLQNGMFSGGGGTNLKDSLKLMDAQSMHWKNNTQWYNDNILPDAYVRTRNALERAGYNPLMGIGTPLADQGVMPNATATSNAKQISISKQAFADATLKNLRQDTMLKGAQAEQQVSSANLLNQEKETEVARKSYVEAQTNLANAEKDYKEALTKYTNKEISWYDFKVKQQNYFESIRVANDTRNSYNKKLEANAAQTSANANMIIAKEKQDRDSYTIKIGPVSYSREGKRKTSDQNYAYEPYGYNGKGEIVYTKKKKKE